MIHISTIGGGLGGLCLAQALQKNGIAFDVYERDASPDSRAQGYRLRIDETGRRALSGCLPDDLYALFKETCADRRTSRRVRRLALGTWVVFADGFAVVD